VARSGGSGGDSRRLTKAERKDEARRQREEIQRQMARRRRNRKIVTAAAIVVAVAVVATVVFVGRSAIPSPQDLLARAKTAEKASACSSVQATPNFDVANVTGDVQAAQHAQSLDANTADPLIDHDHIPSQYNPTGPGLSAYPTVPPASGPHAGIPPGPLPAGIYTSPPDIYRAIHSLEHGAAIVWYSPSAPADLVSQLTAFYGQKQVKEDVGQDRVLVAPYDYGGQGSAAQLPKGVQMALVAWHRLETCGQVNLAAAFDFTSQYSVRRTSSGGLQAGYPGRQYKGVAREAGSGL
jgi:Protein of unknown function (DUF3105)